jgi:hypothetical protein
MTGLTTTPTGTTTQTGTTTPTGTTTQRIGTVVVGTVVVSTRVVGTVVPAITTLHGIGRPARRLLSMCRTVGDLLTARLTPGHLRTAPRQAAAVSDTVEWHGVGPPSGQTMTIREQALPAR